MWLTDLLTLVKENYEYMCSQLLQALPKLRISPMDGTYLVWIDFGAYVKAEDMHNVFEINVVSPLALANGSVVKATLPLCDLT